MMISLSKSQLIISNVVLACLVILIIYLLIVFARIKSNQGNKSITANRSRTKVSNRQRYFSLAVDDDSRPLVDCNVNSKLSPGSNGDGNIVNIGVNGARASADDHIEDENGEIEEPLNFNDPYQEKAKIYNDENQIMQHISLIIILTFNTLLCLFFQMWILFDESRSGIFYELKLIDLTLHYGQGFFTFLIFGFDENYIFSPVIFKMKEWFNYIKPYNLPKLEDLDPKTIEICQKFNEKYKEKCIASKIVKDQRFHYEFYFSVFKGSDLIDWLLKKKLIKNRKQGQDLGKCLINGRVISHVTEKRHFYDGFNLYKFN
jgi:hypothetical protein